MAGVILSHAAARCCAGVASHAAWAGEWPALQENAELASSNGLEDSARRVESFLQGCVDEAARLAEAARRGSSSENGRNGPALTGDTIVNGQMLCHAILAGSEPPIPVYIEASQAGVCLIFSTTIGYWAY